MRKLLLLLLLPAALSAFGQDKMVTINVYVPGIADGTAVYLLEPVTLEKDSAIVKNERFSFKKDMTQGGSTHVLYFGKLEDEKGAVIYIEPGQLNITGKGNYLMNADYSGSYFAADWYYAMSHFSDSSAQYRDLGTLSEKYKTAAKIGDDEARIKYHDMFEKLRKQRLSEVAEWIRQNPNSGVAPYLFNIFMYLDFPPDSVKPFLERLGPRAQQSRLAWRMFNPGKESFKNMPNIIPFIDSTFTAGKPAPLFAAHDPNGKMISLSDFKGKYVLIDFWASWCKPCMEQVPYLKTAYERFRNKNFEIVGISLDDKRERWLGAVAAEKLSWKQISELKGWKEPAAETYKVTAIPANLLIGPDGKIIATNLMGEKLEEKLKEILN